MSSIHTKPHARCRQCGKRMRKDWVRSDLWRGPRPLATRFDRWGVELHWYGDYGYAGTGYFCTKVCGFSYAVQLLRAEKEVGGEED